MSLPEVPSVERLSLRPGDRLVLSYSQRISDEEFDSIRRDVTETWGLPEGVKVIILDCGASLRVRAREDP